MLRVIAIILFAPIFALADTVFLKSGAAIQGAVTELNQSDVQLKREDGAATKFSLDLVQAILDDEYRLIWGTTTKQIDIYVVIAKSQAVKTINQNDSDLRIHANRERPIALGIRCSLNLSQLAFDPNNGLNTATVARFAGGVSLLEKSGNMGFVVDGYYIGRGVYNSGEGFKEDISIHYLGISPGLQLYLDNLPRSLFFQIGMAIEFKISSHYHLSSTQGDVNMTPDLRSMNLPLVLGIGFQTPTHKGDKVGGDIRYLVGLTDIGKHDVEIHTSDILFTLSYYFNYASSTNVQHD